MSHQGGGGPARFRRVCVVARSEALGPERAVLVHSAERADMVDEGGPDSQQRTVSVEPRVHVETFATHCTVTWKANGLEQFVPAVRDLDCLSSTAPTVVDATDTAGRVRTELSAINASDVVTYLRIEPDASWALAWERRTWPVVSLSGTPSPERCRAVHLATTDCSSWDDDAVRTLAQMTASVRRGQESDSR